MSGDWIKIRVDLFEDADVMRLSDILGTDDLTTVGLLVRFWAWANKQTADGSNVAITSARIDRLVGRDGFAEGMRQIGWLSGRDGSLCLPRFERHNGSSAKARALESEAKQLRRQMSDNMSDKCPTKDGDNVRPEKRREEKSNNPLTPKGGFGDGKDSKNLPTTEQAKRVGAIMHRRPTSPWQDKEVRAYRKLGTIDEEDLAAVEAYYADHWPPDRDKNILRHDLATLLNNWPGEVTRAHNHRQKGDQQTFTQL